MSVILLAAGGAAGAVARHRLGAFILKREKHDFPVGIFLINILGALLLGILCGLGVGGSPYLLLGDGFCGAFTTFSTFMVESAEFIKGNAVKKAAAYVGISVTFGILFFAAGYQLGNIFIL